MNCKHEHLTRWIKPLDTLYPFGMLVRVCKRCDEIVKVKDDRELGFYEKQKWTIETNQDDPYYLTRNERDKRWDPK